MNSIAELPPVLTPEEVASVMRLTPEQVQDVVSAGELEAFDFCGFTRITKESLLKAIAPRIAGAARSTANPGDTAYSIGQFEPAEPFEYTWPTAKGKPKFIERYPRVFKTVVTTAMDRTLVVEIGITVRESSGMQNRARVVVFIDGQPMVEFIGANDFDRSHRLVSIIKPDGYKHLRVGQPVPTKYDSFERLPFDEIVIGPRAKRGIGVVCKIDDLGTMVRHALLRWDAKQGDFQL